MTSPLELVANACNAASILLAGRRSIHTWWLGIAGCLLFMQVFAGARLYADATLQLFFVVTSVLGWWRWRRPLPERPIRRTAPPLLAALLGAGIAVALSYAWLLHRFTDAYAPVLDSMVLIGSALGQFLLVARRLETWWCWLFVNTISVPLLAVRGLHLTAALYTLFWLNAAVSLRAWQRLVAV
jgi:nicotinamide mononucleotide transporter